jgi:signal transduction histidine kinase
VIARKYKNDIPEEGKVYLKYIEEAIAKMQSLLEETLLFAKSRKENNVEAVSVAIRPVLKDCLFNLQSEIEESKVSIHIQKEVFPKVECNKTQLLQVFQNLVSNAIKFKGSEHPQINISCSVEGSFSKFSIKDNGVGIPAESQSSIFEMFSRAENTQDQEGSGIGLATCKKIINHFGGKIWVESNEKGSNFFFTLPIAQEDLEKFTENKNERLVYLKR